MKDELIRPVNFETGETIYFDPDELQKGNLVQITKEESEEKEKKYGAKLIHVTKIDLRTGMVTVK